jgi:hypothetical protein
MGGNITRGHTMQQCQYDLIRNNEISIKENIAVISKNARRYTIGAYCGIAAPFVGAVAWLIAPLIMKI